MFKEFGILWRSLIKPFVLAVFLVCLGIYLLLWLFGFYALEELFVLLRTIIPPLPH